MNRINEKDLSLLIDQKEQEALCLNKCESCVDKAQDLHLRALYTRHYQHSLRHIDALDQLLEGQMPGEQNQTKHHSVPRPQPARFPPIRAGGVNDAGLCGDLLTTENQLAQSYSLAIPLVSDPQIREVLSGIQKDVRHQGDTIKAYMVSRGISQ